MLLLDGNTTTPAVTPLSGNTETMVLVLIVSFVLLAGGVVYLGRRSLEGTATDEASGTTRHRTSPDRTLIRSWLAITLVGSLVFFCAVSFALDDASLRSSLIGGLVASAGAATAFYFASKSSDQARRDILAASSPQVHIPSVIGDVLADVNAALATIPVSLQTDPTSPDAGWTAVKQFPAGNTSAPANSAILVTFAAPAPPQPADPPH